MLFLVDEIALLQTRLLSFISSTDSTGHEFVTSAERRQLGYKGYIVCLLVPGLAQHGEQEAGAQPRRDAHDVKMHSPDLILF